ncbi:type IV pilus twitching motility protein PilT [bacterium]
MQIEDILKKAISIYASDVHIVPGRKPMVRVRGDVQALEEFEVLTRATSKELVCAMLTSEHQQFFSKTKEYDFSMKIEDVGRFRVNVLMQKDGVGAVLRVIPSVIPTAKQLMIPQAAIELTKLQRGLVLLTGPTGCGKSTTIASLIDIINETYPKHILTIEDPIEYVFDQKKSIVTQREIGDQTLTFHNALKHALRQDPDVIVIGEMRDLDTISTALTLAETGHIVFATLHTSDAPQTIDRIVDVFPPYQQQQIRSQLSITLKAVISQQLVKTKDGKGRVAAREIMIINSAISHMIREGKTAQIYGAIETGKSVGMISMDKSLTQLVSEGLISRQEAMINATNPLSMQRLGM